MAEPVAIEIRHLCKIFGPRPERMLPLVRQGIGRDALRDRYGHVLALRDVTLTLPGGGIEVIMGLSGSGKSTLLRHINRLIEPTAGELRVGGEDVLALAPPQLRDFRRTRTAMVFQSFALLPHLTVRDNAAFGLRLRGHDERARHALAAQWLARVGLEGDADRYPRQLSGGMQQRVGLARALATDAPVLLMDEPFSALDPLIRHEMQDLLLALQRDMGKTIVFITHDLDEALRLGDRIAILREGAVVQHGSGQDLLLRPADDEVRRFVQGVRRGRVLRCAALAQGEAPADAPTVDGDLAIEQAVQRLNAAGHTAANVAGRAGEHLGVVHLRALIAAMLPPPA